MVGTTPENTSSCSRVGADRHAALALQSARASRLSRASSSARANVAPRHAKKPAVSKPLIPEVSFAGPKVATPARRN